MYNMRFTRNILESQQNYFTRTITYLFISDLFSCSMQGLSFWHMESLVVAHELQKMQRVGLVAPWPVGS